MPTKLSPARIAVTSILALAYISLSWADSWLPPAHEIVASPNGKFLLELIPDRAGEYASSPTKNCEAILFERTEADLGKPARYAMKFKWTLVNPRAPATAIVANDGKHVVTVDDWFDVGRGQNVIVIYKASGKIIKRFSLGELASKKEIDGMVHSTASTWWSGKIAITEDSKLLKVMVITSGSTLQGDARFREVNIELAGGRIVRGQPDNR